MNDSRGSHTGFRGTPARNQWDGFTHLVLLLAQEHGAELPAAGPASGQGTCVMPEAARTATCLPLGFQAALAAYLAVS